MQLGRSNGPSQLQCLRNLHTTTAAFRIGALLLYINCYCVVCYSSMCDNSNPIVDDLLSVVHIKSSNIKNGGGAYPVK